MSTNPSVDAFLKRLNAIPKVAREEARKEIEAQALKLARFIKSVAPRGTGKLAESVRYQTQEFSAFVKAGGPLTTKPVREGSKESYDYSLAIEHGTANMPAQPFFYPSYRLHRKSIKAAIARAVKRGVGKIVPLEDAK